MGFLLWNCVSEILTVALRHYRDGTAQSRRQEYALPFCALRYILIRCSGVVDPRLKIYGLANVRVVDASVIPLTTGVAIQSTVYAIAEKVGLDLNPDYTL